MSSKCPRCEKSVYAAEQVLGAGEKWHKMCFSCQDCKKMLDSTTVANNGRDIYCKSCHGRNFGPKGYGFGGGAGCLSTEGGGAGIAANASGNSGKCKGCGQNPGTGKFCANCGNKL